LTTAGQLNGSQAVAVRGLYKDSW